MIIKVCGMTRAEDVEFCDALGIDLLGFIFHPESPRNVTPEWVCAQKPGRALKTGVFVRQGVEEIRSIATGAGLDLLQLHGGHTVEQCLALGPERVIKTMWPERYPTVERLASDMLLFAPACRAILLDSGKSGGGHGRSLSPKDLQKLQCPHPWYLAGGLGPHNLAVMKTTGAAGFDLNSGVESSPGIKDHEKYTPPYNYCEENHEQNIGHAPAPFRPLRGRYVPEMLVPALEELEQGYLKYKDDPEFTAELTDLYQNYCGRPTPLYYAENLTRELGGCKIYLKLEGLAHTGAHKINNALGQALLAKRLGKTKVIAETGAGQHGLASATVAARFGLACKVFMGEVDVRRQYPNVYAMKLLGAEVVPVTDGTKTLKDAVNATLKYWIQNLTDTHYILGSALGPFPYPVMVRDFQSVIGREVRAQIIEREGRLPDHLVACVGGGSNSIGLFHPFLGESGIRFHGAEAGGRGPRIGDNAARFGGSPKVGIVQGYKSYFLQDESGQLQDTHSVSAGLDYAGVGPELAWLYDQNVVEFSPITDVKALDAFKRLTRREGIIPALESSHAVARAIELAPTLPKDEIMIVNISGRGDKDIFITAMELDRENWIAFLENEVRHGK